jgi:hypothetical protein
MDKTTNIKHQLIMVVSRKTNTHAQQLMTNTKSQSQMANTKSQSLTKVYPLPPVVATANDTGCGFMGPGAGEPTHVVVGSRGRGLLWCLPPCNTYMVHLKNTVQQTLSQHFCWENSRRTVQLDKYEVRRGLVVLTFGKSTLFENLAGNAFWIAPVMICFPLWSEKSC